MNCSEALNIDGDIAGTGVRVSFYIQNILLVLLMKRSPGDTENALWTFVATSFGLTVAALAQLHTHNLSFLDGILVSQLVWFSNLGTFLALASYSRSKGKDIIIKLVATLQGYFSMVLTLVMWAKSDRLVASDCPSIKFVFMFAVPLPAIGSGRVTALVFSSLALVVFTGLTGIEVWVWVKRGRMRTGRIPDPEIGHSHEHRGTRSRHHGRDRYDRFHNRWAQFLANLGSFFFGILLAQIFIFAYFVTTTELIIRRSHAINPTTWTFGQVLAITVVIPSLIALLRNIRDKWCQCGEEEEIIRNDLNRSRLSNIGHMPQPSPSIPLMPYTREPSRGLSIPHSEEPQPESSS